MDKAKSERAKTAWARRKSRLAAARIPDGPRVNVRMVAADLEELKAMGLAKTVAAALHQLLVGSRLLFWDGPVAEGRKWPSRFSQLAVARALVKADRRERKERREAAKAARETAQDATQNLPAAGGGN